MAKDDYFVIVYRILTYLYECFKAGEAPVLGMYQPETIGINNGYWANVLESMLEEGYIKGAEVIRMAGNAKGVKVADLRITPKGIEYLKDNSMMARARDFLRTVKETVPGF